MSGALAGLGGAVLVFGSESHRMVTDGSTLGFTGGAGFNGIVAALLGGLHPLWTIPASFLFGGLIVGGQALQRAVQVPSALIVALNGLVVIFVVAADRYRMRLLAEDGRDMIDEARDAEPSAASSAREAPPSGTDSFNTGDEP
jgi:simple sugar transport system permease protein